MVPKIFQFAICLFIVFVLSRCTVHFVLEKLIQQIGAEVDVWVLRMGQLDRWGDFGLGRVARQQAGRL